MNEQKKEIAHTSTRGNPLNDVDAVTNSTNIIVPVLPPDVKALRELRSERHIPVADIVEVVSSLYPRFDRYLLSKVEHGEEYGIQLRPKATKLLREHFAVEPSKPRKSVQRKKPKRIQARVTNDLYEALQRITVRMGITTQDVIENLILDFVNQHKEDKPNGH